LADIYWIVDKKSHLKRVLRECLSFVSDHWYLLSHYCHNNVSTVFFASAVYMLRFVAFAFATVCWLIKIYICNLLPFPYVPSHFSYPIYFNLDPSFFLSFYFAHTFLLALFFFRSSSSYFFLHRTVSYVLLPTNFSLLSPIFRHITPVSYPSFTPYAKLHQRKVNRLYF